MIFDCIFFSLTPISSNGVEGRARGSHGCDVGVVFRRVHVCVAPAHAAGEADRAQLWQRAGTGGELRRSIAVSSRGVESGLLIVHFVVAAFNSTLPIALRFQFCDSRGPVRLGEAAEPDCVALPDVFFVAEYGARRAAASVHSDVFDG